MTPDECRKVARIVAGIVVTDDVLEPAEERFVDKMLDELSIADEERGAVFPIIDGEEAAQELSRMSPEIQEEVIEMLIQAAAVDGEVVPEELDYLKAVTAVTGLDDDELQTRLDSAVDAHSS